MTLCEKKINCVFINDIIFVCLWSMQSSFTQLFANQRIQYCAADYYWYSQYLLFATNDLHGHKLRLLCLQISDIRFAFKYNYVGVS